MDRLGFFKHGLSAATEYSTASFVPGASPETTSMFTPSFAPVWITAGISLPSSTVHTLFSPGSDGV